MTKTFTTCIVIPCYNEAKGILIQEYSTFLENYSHVIICLVNDGSTDKTLQVFNEIKQKFPEQIYILSLLKNSGKAEAVRQGINYCSQTFSYTNIGYLDADLATSLEEFMEVSTYLQNKIEFCFGSRIRKIGSNIQRQNSRFLIGRVIATFISQILDLKVYDTQCGCKVFSREIAEKLFREDFISKWLFDVELFFRMKHFFGREKAIQKIYEVPLRSWIEKGNSKVQASYFFKLWFDLYKINKRYKRISIHQV
jgi:glycosyltransferase involved in cell wall biosynthesis